MKDARSFLWIRLHEKRTFIFSHEIKRKKKAFLKNAMMTFNLETDAIFNHRNKKEIKPCRHKTKSLLAIIGKQV